MTPKEQAASKALEYIKSGMVVGLGSGSTAKIFVDMLGAKLKSGELKNIIGIPTSEATDAQARELGIPLSNLAEQEFIHVTCDGADEVDPNLNLVKGWGRALLREKIVASQSEQLIIMVDESKMVERLGTRDFIPVEVVPFGYEVTLRFLNNFPQGSAELWIEDDPTKGEVGKPVVTDNGNYIIKARVQGGLDNPHILNDMLETRTGVPANGLFLGMATTVIVGNDTGIRVLDAAI